MGEAPALESHRKSVDRYTRRYYAPTNVQTSAGILREKLGVSPEIECVPGTLEPANRRNSSTPSRIRTCDLRIRSPLLYPAELWAREFQFKTLKAIRVVTTSNGYSESYSCGHLASRQSASENTSERPRGD